MRLCALCLSGRGLDRADAARTNEIFMSQFPGNAEGVQDVSLGGLAAGAPFFDGVDRSWRNVGAFREVILGPAKCLSGGADAIHGGQFSDLGGC